MCGISGLFRQGGLTPSDLPALKRMNEAIRHRGPDDEGIWTSEQRGVALGQRRLAIQDLSPAGAQPMLSASGRYAITLNGEIYNFHDLRAELEQAGKAPAWRGHSDTEVALAAIEAFGLDGALPRLRGMFAFALYDHQSGTIALARDPMGEKPLFWSEIDGALTFASELKALKAHPAWRGDLDRTALTQFLRHGYIVAPATLYRSAHKIRPGSYRLFGPGEGGAGREVVYWDSVTIATASKANRFAGSFDAATDELDRLLNASIRRQVIADVPVGAFLSGGIDSSTIAAIMQAQRSTPIETFSLGFKEAEFDESRFARDIARHLGTSHNEIQLSGQDACDLVTRMPATYDEPFADPSQLPTWLVTQFARTKVTVALSGDAGDELFAGYGRYHSLRRKWDSGLKGQAHRLGASLYYRMIRLGLVRPALMLGRTHLGKRSLHALDLRLADLEAPMGAGNVVESYERSFTVIDPAHRLVRGAMPAFEPLVGALAGRGDWSALDQATLLDAVRYLPDDILVKVDRAAMAHSLETRIPLLDPDIIRFAWSLPDELKMRGRERKALLRAVLGRYVPRNLWDRPKQGFGIPAADWLRGPFRTLASDLFSKERLNRQGLLDTTLVQAIWADFLAGGQRRVNLIWTLFIAQLYLDAEERRA
ncbi:MAG: asparagine synthase (glutamine-hydrolyzing) [Beijerinckiaceae bacterium]|nr:asparagine synthase (glutamine-hydrolyzing) [Beijerinckiaceae bacterium]MCZ8299849.1 asparagine synthase (glutamine-hydrolyzing) [Beijerinckiaceae bacterium]